MIGLYVSVDVKRQLKKTYILIERTSPPPPPPPHTPKLPLSQQCHQLLLHSLYGFRVGLGSAPSPSVTSAGLEVVVVVAAAASSWKPIPARMLSLGSDGKAVTLGQQVKAVHIMHRTNRLPERAARARPLMVDFGFRPHCLTAARSLFFPASSFVV